MRLRLIYRERVGVIVNGILSACASRFEMWETAYYHIMPSHQALMECVRSTRLRPYEVIFKFNRFFFTAHK